MPSPFTACKRQSEISILNAHPEFASICHRTRILTRLEGASMTSVAHDDNPYEGTTSRPQVRSLRLIEHRAGRPFL